jgi:hypothetical protein
MLLGRNPFETLRAQENNPGHFREYTKRELCDMVTSEGYRIELWYAADYLDYRFVHHEAGHDAAAPKSKVGAVANALYRLMPPSMRPGQTVVARVSG